MEKFTDEEKIDLLLYRVQELERKVGFVLADTSLSSQLTSLSSQLNRLTMEVGDVRSTVSMSLGTIAFTGFLYYFFKATNKKSSSSS